MTTTIEPIKDGREQFLADVFTAAIEGGINYWAEVNTYRWQYCGDDEGVPGRSLSYRRDFYAVVRDHDQETAERAGDLRIDAEVIQRGAELLAEQWKDADEKSYAHRFVIANRTNGEDGDYDAGIADQVVQTGLFGSVVYG
ncbi:hypothetical protein [Tsukamurella spumae]|uniref:Uncharacterized protein n=1 Tax=Tsukamurella spumae TaxID=44753 RepID=A0A846X2C8_9ACTN|nr:hypothetical protein [Tsukamurella spumae]NKY19464.1 hypothetical protein [Tsukamurella spumae]